MAPGIRALRHFEGCRQGIHLFEEGEPRFSRIDDGASHGLVFLEELHGDPTPGIALPRKECAQAFFGFFEECSR
jgi:hypothetical protein